MDLLPNVERQFVLDVLEQGRDLTVATIRPDGYPQATVVNFVHRDLLLFAAIGIDSQKANNIRKNAKVAGSVSLDYGDLLQIRGINFSGRAGFLTDQMEMGRVSDCLLRKYPSLSRHVRGTSMLPWSGQLFLCIEPHIVSLIDYTHGFGHTSQYAVACDKLPTPHTLWADVQVETSA